MTTTKPRVLPACLTPDVCEYPVGINPIVRCGKDERWHDGAIEGGVIKHDFQPHEHARGECSAAFYRAMGCDATSTLTGIPWCQTPEHEQFHLADPIYAPDTPEAREAAWEVLAGMERSGMVFDLSSPVGEGDAREPWSVVVHEDQHVTPYWCDDGIAELPRAICLAWWAATLAEGGR